MSGLCLGTALASTAVAGPERLDDSHFLPADPVGAEIGRLLFFDPILSGNRNIACATCHHPEFGSSDGLSLGIGEGGDGVGDKRVAATTADRIKKRIPRNSPALWNLGASEIDVLFHDGRLSKSDLWGNGFNSPIEENLPEGLKNILAAQALFPLVATFEMAGEREENDVATAAHRRTQEAWPLIARRVRGIPEYAEGLMAANPDLASPEDIEITHVVNALADFINLAFRSFDSPYDRYLAGDADALSDPARRGMELFFGRAGCDGCHSGPLLSDQSFHALGLPHIGPGRTRRFDPYVRDVGRMAETDRLEDAYRFRTPMLRNVAKTAPYGHNGAYRTLEGIVRHHLDPEAALDAWTRAEPVLPEAAWLAAVDFVGFEDSREMERLRRSISIRPVALDDAEVADLISFLGALTGTDSLRQVPVPERVPSGLKVE